MAAGQRAIEGAATARLDGDTCGGGSTTAGATSQLVGSTWVRTSDRWTITAIATNGDLRAVHQTNRQTVILPAGYVNESVELGYACTIHGAQGVTADVLHGIATGAETRQQLYTGPFPVWWTLVRFAVPDRVKGS